MRTTLLVFFGLFLFIVFGCGGGGGGGGTNTGGGTTGGLAGVDVVFYDNFGGELARATSDVNGDFAASVPTDVRFFQPDPNTINTLTHYRHYYYGGKSYSAIDPNCRTPLPTIPDGGDVTLPGGNIAVLKQGPPPPPPTGCSASSTGTGSGGVATLRGKVVEL